MTTSKKILTIPFIIISLAIIGYLLLVCVYMIPEKYITPNIKKSTYIFSHETSYYSPAAVTIDNWTDALMMLTAAHPVTENVFKAAARSTRYRLPDKTPTETLLHLYTQNIPPEVQEFFYHRYWHGYLVYYKPLLAFCSLQQIRPFLAAFQLILFTLLVIKLVQINRYAYSYAILAVWIFMSPVVTMSSLTLSNISILTFIALLVVTYFYNRWEKSSYVWAIVFLILGCLTSYIDLLTYPLVSLGIPLLLWVALFTNNFSEAFRYSGIFSIHWILGYAGMWISKWVIGSIVLGQNLFLDASNAAKIRLHGAIPGDDYTFYDCIIKQFYASKVIVNIVIVCILCSIITIAIYKKRFIMTSKEWIYACIACYPFMWYAVITNHSYIHAFMTYRLLSIPLFALCLFTIQSCQFGKGNT